jgi:hypothetical protein
MRKIIVEMNPQIGLTTHYKITFPEIIISGFTIYDNYRKKHFSDKKTIILQKSFIGEQSYNDLIKTLDEKSIPYRLRLNRIDNGVRIMIDITDIINDPERLCDENGNFVSSCPGGPDTGTISIGYLEELCEWVYHFADLPKQELLQQILALEECTRQHLKEMGIGFVPTWSKKIQTDIDNDK